MLTGKDIELQNQILKLKEIVESVSPIDTLLRIIESVGGIEFWISGETISRVVWNKQNNLDALHGVHAMRVIYYKNLQDQDDCITNIENIIKHRCNRFDLDVKLTNTAVYDDNLVAEFGKDVKPFESLYEAIGFYAGVNECFAIRRNSGKLRVIAPYGLEDVFCEIYRLNKVRTDVRHCDVHGIELEDLWPFITRVS